MDNPIFLERANAAAAWIIRTAMLPNGGVRTRHYYDRDHNGSLYSFENDTAFTFDTAMVLYGFCSLYQKTRDTKLLDKIRRMADFIVGMQREDGLFHAFMDKNGRAVTNLDKWSNRPSPFHSKISLSLIEAYNILHDEKLKRAAISACERSALLIEDGRFITSADDVSETHPNLYAAEGLFYAGIEFNRKDFVEVAAQSVSTILSKFDGKLPCSFNKVSENKNMRLDTVAQALRLGVMLAERDLIKNTNFSEIYKTLVLYQISDTKQKGGFLYGKDHNGNELSHPNSWVTMFAAQAMIMYNDYIEKRKIEVKPFV